MRNQTLKEKYLFYMSQIIAGALLRFSGRSPQSDSLEIKLEENHIEIELAQNAY